MVPPTGASDSIILRRNGAPIEAYYGVPKPQIKNYPMENEGEKSKKSWGERWKINKSEKIPESANFMVHPDYLYKYGTLSNGTLNKSLKCAETWLYGTVGVRGTPAQRPSLFLYPGVVAPGPRIVTQNGYVSAGGAFVSVPIPRYACSDRNGFGITISTKPDSKICQCAESRKDTRKSNTPSCKKCGGRRHFSGSVKLNRKTRPTLLEVTTTPEKILTPASASDPYNMMRKNRLGVGESVEPSIFSPENSQRRRRNRSSSPLRGKTRDQTNPSFETFKPKQPEEEPKSWKADEENWSNDEEEKTRRRSILECDLNPYDLNRKKNKSKIDDEDDEDSSDELSDGTLEVNSKLKILRPKLNKTDLRNRKINIPEPGDKLKKLNESNQKSEVRLNGQRFKIFDHSNPSTEIVEEYVSDEEENGKNKEMIPRLASPKRPPRRHKEKSAEEIAFKYSKLKSKSSPNLSIKSILKKPINEESDNPLLESDLASSDTSSESKNQTSLIVNGIGNGHSKQSQNTLKKKKQVQFKVVVNSNESLNEAVQKNSEEPTTTTTTKEEEEEQTKKEETVARSKSCEDLLLMDDVKSECTTGNGETKCDDRKELAEEDPRILHTEDDIKPPSQGSSLKRSFSDRRPSSAVVLYKDEVLSLSTSPPNSYLFNDTMALRTRGTRIDTREIFIDENGKVHSDDENPKQNGRLRPKEPPPPPPPPPISEETKLPGNIITYAEFARLIDEKTSSPVIKSPPSPPPRQIFPFTTKTRLSDPGFSTVKVNVPSRNRLSEPTSPFSKLDNHVTLCDNCENGMKNLGKTIVTVSQEPKSSGGKTSVMIGKFHLEDKNKVTISVRTEEEPNSSSCTIIETGSNSTVIPVLSTDNKTTLIVGNNSSVIPEEPVKPSQYIFSTQENEKLLDSLDPVEAIRRNLIPHICGKEENGQTLMEKIKQSRESNLKQISQLFMNGTPEEIVSRPAESLLTTYQSKKSITNWKSSTNGAFKIEEDSSSTASRSNSFCSSSTKNSSTTTSRSNSFRSNSYKSPESDYDTNPFLPVSIARSKFYILSDSEDATVQEKDKLEDEYEIRNPLTHKKDAEEITENIYETIKEEPIYDQVGIKLERDESDDDIPPPLPLTLPPSLDEIERSPKSIFEGASKYDILSYLVDAKDRVQEDCYFSGSSTSEEIEGRRLCSLEESENASLDSGMHCRTPSDGLETEESLRRMENCKENDSGVDLSSRISHLSHGSDSSEDNLILTPTPERDSLKLNRKSSAEIERNDSGVGSETSQSSRSKWQASSSIREDPQHLCEDCDQIVETQVTDSGVMYAPLVCRKCSKRRQERKEIIQEIVETEEKYGRDLRIILEEFYKPMLVAGLLTPEQLTHIFLNTEELLDNNEQLTDKLRDSLEIAIEQGDEDLLTVNIGKLFLEAGPMLHAFESYCTRQASAAVLLASLEKDKELLRIFLRVSQMENTVLRRMNLNSFLMVPVQRVTKYPLLLARLYKVTPPQHEGRELLKEAQHNIELHLEHMNSEAKDVSATKVWRRFSASTGSGRKTTAELEMINIKLRKMAVDILEWNHEEVRFVLEGKLLYTQPTDNNWKRGRTIKLTPIFVLLVTLGKPNSKYKTDPPEDELTFPTKTGIREATLLLVKEKCGRYTLIREPLFLDKIIVCCETDIDEYFEIQELSTKDTFIFKAEDGERTKEWYRQLQYHAQILGSWRRRRNALANIMINGMMARTYTS